MGLNNLANDNYRYFVPKGTKNDLAKSSLEGDILVWALGTAPQR